ncbi:asparagine synthetase [glutamine-hydrolyzing]-like [Argopecten irradians]|uniref:asparagine synthetase [glutamine-hydrolyzing]-like n=1 Tax=Argopecten irradians TaxID=31199 RepID=UPI003715C2D9
MKSGSSIVDKVQAWEIKSDLDRNLVFPDVEGNNTQVVNREVVVTFKLLIAIELRIQWKEGCKKPVKIHCPIDLENAAGGYDELSTRLQEKFHFSFDTHCDGEAIIHLFAHGGIEFAARQLDGVFAFCLLDTEKRKVYLGRDTFGVKPLYRLTKKDGSLSVCSEVKGLMDIVGYKSDDTIQHVLPGHVEIYNLTTECRASLEHTQCFHHIGDIPNHVTSARTDSDIKTNIRTLLRSAVDKRLMSERRIGCLLSGLYNIKEYDIYSGILNIFTF